jgi:shikimate kinase
MKSQGECYMILVLIGYRGTGKSLVGRLLSRRLNMPCIAMDEEIERQAGISIAEIVEKHGWQRFRDLESEMARELMAGDDLIIDTGGGVIERPENIEVLQKNACVVWLKASVETVVSRISSGTHRPSLTGGKTFTDEVAEVLARRTPIYQKAAQYEVDTDDLTPEEIAGRVLEAWNSSHK